MAVSWWVLSRSRNRFAALNTDYLLTPAILSGPLPRRPERQGALFSRTSGEYSIREQARALLYQNILI
jgi:hypothetical protein